MKSFLRVWVAVGCCGALACGSSAGVSVDFRRSPESKGGKVASVGNDALTVEQLQSQWASLTPYARAQYQDPVKRRDYVDSLARFDALVQEAVRRKLYQDPEVLEATRKAMVQALLRQELDQKPFPVTDAQVQAFFQAHKENYERPASVRLAHVFFKLDEGNRPAQEKRAETVLALARKATRDTAAFVKLVQAHSDDKANADGDMKFLTLPELEAAHGPGLVAAAQELNTVGEVYPKVVQGKAGLHIVMLQGKSPAVALALEQVKTSIQSALVQESRQARYAQFLEEVMKRANYAVDDAALKGIELDLKAAPVERKAPQPGFVPAPQVPKK